MGRGRGEGECGLQYDGLFAVAERKTENGWGHSSTEAPISFYSCVRVRVCTTRVRVLVNIYLI